MPLIWIQIHIIIVILIILVFPNSDEAIRKTCESPKPSPSASRESQLASCMNQVSEHKWQDKPSAVVSLPGPQHCSLQCISIELITVNVIRVTSQ